MTIEGHSQPAITPALLEALMQSLWLQTMPDSATRASMAGTVPGKNKPTTNRTAARARPLNRRRSTTLDEAVAEFGAVATSKLSNASASGQPEDQLRSPLEHLIGDVAAICRPAWRDAVVLVGETLLGNLKTRPDFAVSMGDALVGFVEVKAPGKGADPRRFRDRHDKDQWEKLRSLPNLVYTDGNEFTLWRYGELAAEARLRGDVASSGRNLKATPGFQALLSNFLAWDPIPPKDAKQLADVTARLCKLLRDEVTEQLGVNNRALALLAKDWRRVLFPDATDEQFADGYAQVVTFGMLVARAQGISLSRGLDQAGRDLGPTLIGTALRVLTFGGRETLTTSIGTLERVLDAVDWTKISRGDPSAWLYFYEDFLAVYDNRLRKQTGSYYTPPQVVSEMVRLTDEVLRTRFRLADGLASSAVTLIDPAVGTGTFLLGVLRKIAETVEADQGPGAVAAAIDAAVRRLIAFEVQLGPFAVAQLRFLAELTSLIGSTPTTSPRLFVTDTLGNPDIEEQWLPAMLEPIAESRRQANQIKKHERVMVVLGNPPYREKALGAGGWIEDGDKRKDGMRKSIPPLDAWQPPSNWNVSAHAKHLRNLYIYFWRWATWKVFDQNPAQNHGVVCFISVAGFLNGPGFQKMRDYLRRTTDEIWVIDCSPEGHQPDVPTRIFEGVQQPICIVIASRSPQTNQDAPAKVRFRALPSGLRQEKMVGLTKVALDDAGWSNCPTGWREPFLPVETGAWSQYPLLDELFIYNGSGAMPGRTWIIAPDADSLSKRWDALLKAPTQERADLFHPHLQGDKTISKRGTKGLTGHEARLDPVATDKRPCIKPVRYAFRSFDRQWIIPDNRLINRPNPELWDAHSDRQVYMTALVRHSPGKGPGLTITALIPDHDHFKGSFAGRVFPLWRDAKCTSHNIQQSVLSLLTRDFGRPVTAEEVFAYVAAVTAHPGYTTRFRDDLVRPGLRVPMTANPGVFAEAVAIGKQVVWLHSYGERFADSAAGRSAEPPRLPRERAPRIPKGGAIAGPMPDEIRFEPSERRLYVGSGHIDNVDPAVWNYEISGKRVIQHWFSYRRLTRERPLIGERRKPSSLGEIQPKQWPAEYTTELLNLLNVLGRLVDLEPVQSELLDRICQGPIFLTAELIGSSGKDVPPRKKRAPRTNPAQVGLRFEPPVPRKKN